MKIGFLLHKSPEHQDVHTVKKLTEAFVDAGHDVEIFLMEDGVLNALVNHSSRGLSSGFDKLLSKGVNISLCTHTVDIRGLSHESFLKGVAFHSQYDLSRMINECHRFLSFL